MTPKGGLRGGPKEVVDSKRMTPKPRKDGDDPISRSGVSNKLSSVTYIGETLSARKMSWLTYLRETPTAGFRLNGAK
jgi:hypothetical protein